jgi:phage terminase Nu1 subunit (DNA packaging protein)
MATEPLTQAQVAALLNVSARRVRQLEQEQGPLPRQGVGYSAAGLGSYLRGTTSGGAPDPRLERAKLDAVRRLEIELRLKKESRRLLDATEVAERWAGLAHEAKSHLLEVPARVAPRILRLTELREVEQVLRDAIHEALECLSKPRAPAGRDALTPPEPEPLP